MKALFKEKKKLPKKDADGKAKRKKRGEDEDASGGVAAAPPPPPTLRHAAGAAHSSSSGDEDEEPDDVELSYDDMLGRMYEQIETLRPGLQDKKRLRITPPALSRVGTTRIAWTNFGTICDLIKRPQEHVLSYFLAELGVNGSVDARDRMIIRGRVRMDYFQALLRAYVTEYCLCNMCHKLDTTLGRDASTRVNYMKCNSCDSQRSVAAIRAVFHAVRKGDRRRARQAAE